MDKSTLILLMFGGVIVAFLLLLLFQSHIIGYVVLGLIAIILLGSIFGE